MSKQRQKGTQYENHVRDHYLRHIWPTADRAPLRGTADAGDFDGTPYVVEAKKRNRWALPEWIRTTRAKADRVDRPWAIVFAGDKRLKDLDRDFVVTEAAEFFQLHRIIKQQLEILRGAECLCDDGACWESTCDTKIEKGYA